MHGTTVKTESYAISDRVLLLLFSVVVVVVVV